ncbi:uncharacterized protein N7483_005816 [Penicillium malachiteum]|uniref:uncharacterized protein n=1 Tax=Penicillium malachiteum TaxID=1324776 RepID=UPI002548D0D3|nr:uncharacterized protein N7483_005816 [Penicillium malachiteum]KAJ5731308.1 hypothetical protein N7483_005816 [Penicillium malachiteum]
MGIVHSSIVHDCLLAAVGNHSNLVTFQGDFLFDSNIPRYNLDFPVVPVAITYPETTEQVAEIVKCAADNDIKVQAYSGGHSYANYGLGGNDGAIVIHQKNMQHFSMDTETQIATVGPGTNLGDLQQRLYHAGRRAVAHGSCPQVGVGGHFTIGGLGPMSREWGTALDHIEEVEVVLANSSVIRASERQHQDVFFATKGAASSFGIVTEFKIRTHQAPTEAIQYTYQVNLGDNIDLARLFKDWQRLIMTKNLTRKFSSELVLFEGGALLSGVFFGSKEEFQAFGLEEHFPIKNHGTIAYLTDWFGMLASQAEDLIMTTMGGIPASFYAKSMSFTPDQFILDEDVDAMFEYLHSAKKDTIAWFVIFDLEGGATNDPAVDATAYAHRDTFMWMQSYAISLIGPVSSTTKSFLKGLNNVISSSRPGSGSYGAYPGYVDPYMEKPQSAYWGPNLARLQKIKSAIDPNDVFHNPQSVKGIN